MLRADGKDISKKASIRKGRYLMVFNFQLAPAAAGKLGTLACLDSKNPVLYLDFPQGRYKLFGGCWGPAKQGSTSCVCARGVRRRLRQRNLSCWW
jgi:hypothetical protein